MMLLVGVGLYVMARLSKSGFISPAQAAQSEEMQRQTALLERIAKDLENRR